MSIELYNGDCKEILSQISLANAVIVTDPPFNIGYHYSTYKDNLPEQEYYEWLSGIIAEYPAVIVHYPEGLYKLSFQMARVPNRVVSWVYNSNTAKQHRDIAFFGIKPNFKQVIQPYKNPNDKRIKERIARGIKGGRLYDWWNVNQVKNVSKDKTAHPCQMPLQVMKNIIGVLPKNITVVDPFMGAGTTGLACKELGVNFVGIEIDTDYFNIAKKRLEE